MVELLIALVLMGVVGSLLYGVVLQGFQAWKIGGAELHWMQEGYQSLDQMTRDIQRTVTPAQRMGSVDLPVKVLGGSGRWEGFLMDPFAKPGTSALTEVRYQLVGRSLIRQWFAQWAPVSDEGLSVEEVLSDLSDFRVSFLSAQGEWQEEWTQKGSVPRAVQVRLEREQSSQGRTVHGTRPPLRQILTAIVPLS